MNPLVPKAERVQEWPCAGGLGLALHPSEPSLLIGKGMGPWFPPHRVAEIAEKSDVTCAALPSVFGTWRRSMRGKLTRSECLTASVTKVTWDEPRKPRMAKKCV